MKSTALPFLCFVLLTGCAGSLTINSVPQGALISSNKQALGESPESTPLCQGLDTDYTVNIARPSGAPGLDKDLKVANERENVLAQQQQAQAINNVADAIELNSMAGPGPYGYGGYGGWGY